MSGSGSPTGFGESDMRVHLQSAWDPDIRPRDAWWDRLVGHRPGWM